MTDPHAQLQRIMALIREKHEMYEQHMEGADHDDFIKAEWAAGAMAQLYKEAMEIIHQEPPGHGQFPFQVDGKLFHSDRERLTGGEIMALAGVDQRCQLLLEGPARGSDTLISMWDVQDVRGEVFYSLPPAHAN